ncbi:MAG: sulfurtransferase complex subunit TusC [Arenicellales bacterium]|nr:sulfurtransferase complex subunit TusC [Arenicellales bacterium]
MYVNRSAPHGTIYAHEGLEVVLVGAAFDQEVSMAFLGDGVFQLKQAQDTKAIGTKNFTSAYRALADYDVTQLYIEMESLEERGLTVEDLMPLTYEDEEDDDQEKSSITLIDRASLGQLFEAQDVIFNF